MRFSRQGGGMKLFFVKRADEIFSSGGRVEEEYSKRENEIISSGGWGEMILKISSISEKCLK